MAQWEHFSATEDAGPIQPSYIDVLSCVINCEFFKIFLLIHQCHGIAFPQLWLALASLCVLDQDHVDRLSSGRWMGKDGQQKQMVRSESNFPQR